MTWATDIPDATDELEAYFGESATYTPPSGAATTGLMVRVNREEPITVVDDHDRMYSVAIAQVWVKQSALTPVRDGRFTVGSEEWTISDEPKSETDLWSCDCRQTDLERMGERRQQVGGE